MRSRSTSAPRPGPGELRKALPSMPSSVWIRSTARGTGRAGPNLAEVVGLRSWRTTVISEMRTPPDATRLAAECQGRRGHRIARKAALLPRQRGASRLTGLQASPAHGGPGSAGGRLQQRRRRRRSRRWLHASLRSCSLASVLPANHAIGSPARQDQWKRNPKIILDGCARSSRTAGNQCRNVLDGPQGTWSPGGCRQECKSVTATTG
jgi:hypothetical protein